MPAFGAIDGSIDVTRDCEGAFNVYFSLSAGDIHAIYNETVF